MQIRNFPEILSKEKDTIFPLGRLLWLSDEKLFPTTLTSSPIDKSPSFLPYILKDGLFLTPSKNDFPKIERMNDCCSEVFATNVSFFDNTCDDDIDKL